MANTRELSQLASLISVNDETKSIRVIVNQPDAKIGVGTENPTAKVDVSGDVNVSGVITATSFYGDASNLTGISSFSGDYNDLSNKPVIPSDTSDLTNNAGFVTSGIVVGYATEGYVNIAVANLVDSAPETLDTLNELAAALGDDANFSTTITNSLAGKANLSGANFTGVITATSFYGDGSNLSNIISGVGIQSAGIFVGTGVTTLNFVGAGNTFALNGTSVDISIAGGGGGVSISTEAPSDPNEGDLWYSPIYGRTFIYYEDNDSSQWIDAAPFNRDADRTLTIGTRTEAKVLSLSGAGLTLLLRSGISTATF